MCMVFKYKMAKNVKFGERDDDDLNPKGLQNPSKEALSRMEGWKQRREAILKSLQNCGLDLYCYYSRDQDEVIVKIGASAQKLRDTAARMKYKLQLKPQYLSAYAEYRHDAPGRPERQFKDRRVISHIYKTHTEDDFLDSDSIFKTLDKINLIHHVITSTDKDCAGINIGELMHQEELLMAYFPLHEAAVLADFNSNSNKIYWFFPGEEMAHKLRDYFGDRVAFYFLFLGFYLKWLIPLSIVGMALQLIDIIASTPDNFTSILLCIMMSVWATFLPLFWRRQEAKYAIGWGTLDLVETLEPCRPEHTGERMINPVTAQVEPHYPFRKRLLDYALSAAVLLIAAVVIIFNLGLLLIARHEWKQRFLGGPLTFELLTAIYVEISNGMLSLLARKLTTWENHRTQKEHETHILSKVAILKFLNSYYVLFYIAFFKSHKQLFGQEMRCWRNDCMLDLQGQLGVFILFRLTVSNIIEHLMPKMKLAWRTWTLDRRGIMNRQKGPNALTGDEVVEMSPAEQQSKKDSFDEFSNFDEVLVQHGYTTLFAAAAPWVCLATFIGTCLEIFIDMRGLISSRQRPKAMRARDNEPWNTAFEIYGCLAAFTNVFLLIFASNQFDSWSFTEKLVLFLFLEHAIFIARLLVKLALPEVPKNVEVLKLKQDNMVHRCLENIKVEQKQDFSMFRENREERFEVFEQDLFEEDEHEVQLNLAESHNSLRQGIKEQFNAVAKSLHG